MISQSFFAFLASLGFGILFNIKGKNLFFAALGGSLSWFIYLLFKTNNFSEISSLFISSIVFSIYSEICARTLKTPVTTIIICALIPLVPGAGMYYTMYEIISGNSSKALEYALNTLASAGTLALGIIFVSTITRQVTNLKKVKKKLFDKD
ncbi:MAG: threonine/serine exporter [Clostridium butyricum]|nr:threonine/serine exporter [Clostridium butyricum]